MGARPPWIWSDPGVKERGRTRRIDEEGEGGEGVAALLGEGRSPRAESQREGVPLSRRGRGALKGESEGGGTVKCVRERVFGARLPAG